MIEKVGMPKKQGLYNPNMEKDNCGIGFISHIKGEKSHDIVEKGLEILINLTHRGATGCDKYTGDGAGILTQIPHEFFEQECKKIKIELPTPGEYAVGMLFLPRESDELLECEGLFENILVEEGLELLGWRDVPVDHNSIGEIAKGTEPLIKQVFIAKGNLMTELFEKKTIYSKKTCRKCG